jgi:acyl-CoA synthetase (AMP-forming)/AMP-acid ligase II
MWLFTEIKTLADTPRYWGRKTPDAVALVDAVGKVTFAELDDRSNRVAHALVTMGVGPGDRVSYLGQNSNCYFDVLFGVLKAGAMLVPLNWRLAVPEMAAILKDAGPRLIFIDKPYADIADQVLRAANSDCTKVLFDSSVSSPKGAASGLADAEPRNPMIGIDGESTALLLYTSGTTGKPKGVQLCHQGFFYSRLCEHLEPTMKYEPGDLVLTVMPLFHAMAHYFSLQALYNGAAALVYPMPDPEGLRKLIARERPTIVPLVPTAIHMLLNLPNSREADYESVRLMVYAGSSIDPALLARAMRTFNKCKFMQFYGATETGGAAVVFLRPDQHQLDDEPRLKSCGTPFPLVEVKVVDSGGNEVPDGTVGEFLIRAPFLATGYFNQPETTAAAFVDGWYRSGDAGYRDKDGFLFIVDRVKDMIITGGENVYSMEVEHALLQLDGVQMCAIVGMPDPKWGECVVAAIIPSASAKLSSDDVITHCRKLIAGYKVPKDVMFVPSLPMTPTGKVKKRELRDQLISAMQARSGS